MIRQDLEIRDVKRTMSFDPHISLIICQLAPSLVTQGSNPRATQCVVHGPDASGAAGSRELVRNGSGPAPDLPNQDLPDARGFQMPVKV